MAVIHDDIAGNRLVGLGIIIGVIIDNDEGDDIAFFDVLATGFDGRQIGPGIRIGLFA